MRRTAAHGVLFLLSLVHHRELSTAGVLQPDPSRPEEAKTQRGTDELSLATVRRQNATFGLNFQLVVSVF